MDALSLKKYSSSAAVSSLPFPCPKSPPKYPDMSGRRKELAKVQMLEREIGFLEEELKACEGLQLASRSCKEVDDFVVANPDPLIPARRFVDPVASGNGSAVGSPVAICRGFAAPVGALFTYKLQSVVPVVHQRISGFPIKPAASAAAAFTAAAVWESHLVGGLEQIYPGDHFPWFETLNMNISNQSNGIVACQLPPLLSLFGRRNDLNPPRSTSPPPPPLSTQRMSNVQQVIGSLTANDRRILTSLNTGASTLSFAGSTFIVLCYVLFKELRKFSFKLVFFLALADMLCSFFNIIGDPSQGFFCYAQGYSTHFFCVASFLWTTTIAFTLHRTVVRHKTDVEDLEPMFHLYVWGTSLFVTVIRSIGNDPGRLGVWCWSETGRTGKVVHFITFYAPLWGAILFNGLTYFQVIRMINNATRMAVGMSDRSHLSDARADMKALNRWGYYPLILIGSWAFGTINRIHDFIEPGRKIFWLSFLDVGMASLMGLFNSIAYGLNSSVRRAIQERLDLWCPERLSRWLPAALRLRSQPQENELLPLKVQDEQ
ncbi:G-protein coupled receptor [Thalictrum thalictroides]|uniref:G-protein coupled receptor n=1 Tax=Thalictrum thalictroides TaxID=46969 RepID=A0A7J6UXT4_THATH|nr:G-protein coupled receptor [Thalictrum thalictroides]